MIVCKELNKSFDNKEQLFKALRDNAKDIISIKKATIQKSIDKGLSVKAKSLNIYLKENDSVKALPFEIDEKYYYIAVNSTRVLDSHKDLHLDKLWNKSTKDMQGKVYLLDTHQLTLKTTIVKKEEIEMFTAIVPFSAIGKSYSGDTEVLIYKFLKSKVRDLDIKDWLDSGDDIEASVKMRYTDIALAMKSEAKEDEEYLKTFNDYNGIIANKEDFEEEILYFWAIKQAMNVHESSLVPFGSNGATGQIQSEDKAQLKNTLENKEQSNDTQKANVFIKF